MYRILKAFDLITSPAYMVLSAADKFANPTTRVHELWQTDFTYFKIVGWGWYYLASILDDYSRYIIAWKLYTTMGAEDVKDLLEEAVKRTGVQGVAVRHRPRLLSDNGPCYLSKELAAYLEEQGMTHTRGKPFHPMMQGKIERYHWSLKNEVLLQHYYMVGGLGGCKELSVCEPYAHIAAGGTVGRRDRSRLILRCWMSCLPARIPRPSSVRKACWAT